VGVPIAWWESDDIVSPEVGAFHLGKEPVSAGSGWRVTIIQRCVLASASRAGEIAAWVELVRREGPTMGELDSDAKTISSVVGAPFEIHLWEDRTRGELWVPSYDPKVLALANEEFLRTTSNNAVDAGRRSFEFISLAPGTHRLLFEKRMGWKFTAEDRRVFLVSVHDGAMQERYG